MYGVHHHHHLIHTERTSDTDTDPPIPQRLHAHKQSVLRSSLSLFYENYRRQPKSIFSSVFPLLQIAEITPVGMKEMAEETSKEKETVESSEKKETGPVKKKRKGFISRVFNGLFRIRDDDFEKRLQYISKEEATVMTRLKIRSQNWRSRARNLILVSVLAEAIAIGYAIMTTRSLDLDWKMRAIRVLPMFLLPALSSFAYMSLMKIMKICDNKDQKTLERLRAERQTKIDELKERTNYYSTQQLIQRYDPDPAAKAAAATVLASKLGADSGLKLYMQDDSMINTTSGKSNDVEYAQSGGLRNRKQAHVRSNSAGSNGLQLSDKDMVRETGISPGIPEENNQPMVVEHFQHQGSNPQDGGWIAQIAALLVGEDPTQSYALICGNCHMHNGLVRKEDFPFITYFCPHCRALNRSNKSEEGISGSMSLDTGLIRTQGSVDAISRDPLADVTPTNSSRPSSPPLIEEISDGAVAGEIIKKAN